jgi:hypothetical protein
MRALTAEWAEKAENDFRTAIVVLEQIDDPIVDTASFHCQQRADFRHKRTHLHSKEIRTHPR